MDFIVLKDFFLPYLKSLKDFQFTFYNPLFWGILFVLFMILRWVWDTRNAFTFLLLTAVILLVTTELENHAASAISHAGESYDTAIIRLLSVVVVTILFMGYAFLRE